MQHKEKWFIWLSVPGYSPTLWENQGGRELEKQGKRAQLALSFLFSTELQAYEVGSP